MDIRASLKALALDPASWVLLPILVAFTRYYPISTFTSGPQPVTKSFQLAAVVTHVRDICRIHYCISMSNPIDEPESFDILGLDPSKHPFSKPDWLKSGEKFRLEAVDLMMEHWAKRKNRIIKDGQASEREHHLDRVSAALINISTAKVSMAIILLSIWNERGDRRVEVDGVSFVPNGSTMSDVGADDGGTRLWAGSLRMQSLGYGLFDAVS